MQHPFRDTSRTASERIVRFRLSERLLHWCIALPFLICAASAAVLLFYYNPNPARPYRIVFSWIHRVSAVGLMTLPGLVMLANIRDARVYLRNLREGLVWNLDDIRWLTRKPLQALKPTLELPEEGKFNAGEKINFGITTVAYPVLIVSGLLIWQANSIVVPWLVHITVAALALPMAGGHIFMATINPDTRVGLSGMFSGLVDRHWASHHYRRWFKETFPALAAGGSVHSGEGAAQHSAVAANDRHLRLHPALVALVVVLVGGAFALAAHLSGVRLVRLADAAVATTPAEAARVQLALNATGASGAAPGAALGGAGAAVARPCALGAGETTLQACFGRAQEALDACLAACDAGANPTCARDCESANAKCTKSCAAPTGAKARAVPKKPVHRTRRRGK